MNRSSTHVAADSPPGLEHYASALAGNGAPIVSGLPGTYWIRYESYAAIRIPTFVLTPPPRQELHQVLRQLRSAVATYLIAPDDGHPANAWLYVCRSRSYSLESLGVAARRDARRAIRSLRIEFLDWPTVMEHGFPAFSETRTRVGLSDGTTEQFKKRFQRFSRNPFHSVVGAWKGEALVAFMSLVVVDDWAEIEGSFSCDGARSCCPNDGLANFVLQQFLVVRGFHTVSYGLSSVQDAHQAEGLHTYKQKVGFDAVPVHRAFVLHPLLRPLANSLTVRSAKLASSLLPKNRLLRKASGMFATLVSSTVRSSIDKDVAG